MNAATSGTWIINGRQLLTLIWIAIKIGGAKQNICDRIDVYMIGKGGVNAYGGEWKPSKPEDERLVDKPGEIKVTYKKDGTMHVSVK